MVGSFLNVCIVRLPADQSVVRPRSPLPAAAASGSPGTTTSRVLSWLVLRGKLPRTARLPISPLYPAVELATAMIWAAVACHWGLGLEALARCAFFTLLLGIAMTDVRDYIIPDEFSVGGLGFGLAVRPVGRGPGTRLPCVGAVALDSGCSGCRRTGGADVQEGGDGRWGHEDDGDGRRLRRLAGGPAHRSFSAPCSARSSSGR